MVAAEEYKNIKKVIIYFEGADEESESACVIDGIRDGEMSLSLDWLDTFHVSRHIDISIECRNFTVEELNY